MPEDITQIQIDILNELRRRRAFLSGEKLCAAFHLTPQKLASRIRELQNWGYVIERNNRDELKYVSSPDILFPHEIAYGLKARVFGQNIFSFDRVSSTNTVASRYAEKNEPEGTIVIAERQTAGKGRLGRNWHSPAKQGIYLSIILRPGISPVNAPGLSLVAAVSVAKTIMRELKLSAMIKWPNDVLIENRKVAGVLTELAAELDQVRYVIMGIGINVNQELKDFPAELRDKAGSLRIAVGQRVDRTQFTRSLLTNLEKVYRSFVRHGLSAVRKDIKKYSSLLKKQVQFSLNGKTITGTAIDIDDRGMLVVECDGRVLTIGSGEVTLTENY